MNLNYLDGSGNTCQWQPTYLGPTLGMAMLPVTPEIVIDVWPPPGWTGTGPLVLGPFTSRVILRSYVGMVILPPVMNWIQASFQRNQAAFDGSIWVKDLGLNASPSAPILVVGAGTPADPIDGRTGGYKIVAPGELVRLYPVHGQEVVQGWFVG